MLKSTLFIIAFILMHNLCFAQIVVRQSIGTIGRSGSTDGITILQSTGQPYGTSGSSGFQPGFIQSERMSVEKITSTFEADLILYPNPADQELLVKSTTSFTDDVTIQYIVKHLSGNSAVI
jgi:hypothetical protein